MSTAAVTYTFAPNTLIESAKANTNFQDIVDFLNQEVIQRDASIAFTTIPSGPSEDPTTDDQFVRKAYVDMPFICLTRSFSMGSSDLGSVIGSFTTVDSRDVTWDEANDRIEFDVEGVYVVCAALGTGTNTTGRRGVMLKKNGVNWIGDNDDADNTTGFGKRITIAAMDSFQVNDTLSFVGQQSSGSNLTADVRFSVFKVVGS